MTEDFPCIHRGPEPIETRLCDLCGSKGQPFEVYQCALFGECSINRKHSQVKGCAGCEARTTEQHTGEPAALPESIQRINANLRAALNSGQFLIYINWIEDGRVRHERETADLFPRGDFPKVASVLVQGLIGEAPKAFESDLKAKAEARKAAQLSAASEAKRRARQTKKTNRTNKAKGKK